MSEMPQKMASVNQMLAMVEGVVNETRDALTNISMIQKFVGDEVTHEQRIRFLEGLIAPLAKLTLTHAALSASIVQAANYLNHEAQEQWATSQPAEEPEPEEPVLQNGWDDEGRDENAEV